MWNRAFPLFAAVFALSLMMPACRKADQTPAGYGRDIQVPKLVLSPSLEPRRAEFVDEARAAVGIVKEFAGRHGWDSLAVEPFMDSVMVFDDKRAFDRTLLSLVGADTATVLPAGYCAALEQRVLVAVTPEIYSRTYPDGIEEGSYAKLMAHEMCHRLHIRVLEGDEEAMGPVWFFEGFAVYAAGQLASPGRGLSPAELRKVLDDPERGDYRLYRLALEHYLGKATLPELVARAGGKGFDEWLRSLDGK